MSESMALVGLDVHQSQTVAAVLDPVSGELSVERLRGAPSAVVLEFLERLERPLRAIYEAGPTGFGVAGAASERGLDLRVIAPDRLRARARPLLLGGRHPELSTEANIWAPAAAGAHTSTMKAATSPSTGARTRAMGSPATRSGGARS